MWRAVPRGAGLEAPGSAIICVSGRIPWVGAGEVIVVADAQDRLALVGRHVHDKAPLAVVAAEAGVPLRTAQRWLAAYLAKGYLREHFDAVAEGVNLRGYFVWSLMDNFEWAWGYSRRFGLIHLDYDTQVRTIKDSGRWYSQFIAARTAEQRS